MPYGQQPMPYGQQPQPYGQPPYGAPGAGQSGGLTMPTAGWIAYLLWWIGGLIVFFGSKDREARYHGAQSLVVSGAGFVVYLVLFILGLVFAPSILSGGGFGFYTILSLLSWLVIVAIWVAMIYCAIQAGQGKHVKLPVAGDFAERLVAK